MTMLWYWRPSGEISSSWSFKWFSTALFESLHCGSYAKPLTIDVRAALNFVTRFRGAYGLAGEPAVVVLARLPAPIVLVRLAWETLRGLKRLLAPAVTPSFIVLGNSLLSTFWQNPQFAEEDFWECTTPEVITWILDGGMNIWNKLLPEARTSVHSQRFRGCQVSTRTTDEYWMSSGVFRAGGGHLSPWGIQVIWRPQNLHGAFPMAKSIPGRVSHVFLIRCRTDGTATSTLYTYCPCSFSYLPCVVLLIFPWGKARFGQTLRWAMRMSRLWFPYICIRYLKRWYVEGSWIV